MWGGLNPNELDEALDFRARNPRPAPAPEPSFWSMVGETLAAVPKGIGQGAMQSARVANRAGVGLAAGDPFAVSPAEQDELLRDAGATPERADQSLRAGIEALKPDPVTSTTASIILQDASRVLSKVGVYTMAGGLAGAIGGTALDEGTTGYLELRDKGVDPATAAKAGAVRGVSTGLGVALPVAGRTVGQTLGLVVAGGPGAFMAEQALTREILQSANYPELAAEHDPFDPVGLGVSALMTGVIGTVAHRARAKAPAGEVPQPRAAEVADMPEVRDAAHVAYQAHVTEQHMLGDRADPRARATHSNAVEQSTRAMDNGEPVSVAALEVDPARAARIVEELTQRLRAADEQIAAVRATELPVQTMPEPMRAAPAPEVRAEGAEADALTLPPQVQQIVDRLAGLAREVAPERPALPSPLQRAELAAQERPDLPVRMDENDSPLAARELLEEVRNDIARDRSDARAFDAAITCFLRTGP